jgi:hypothetical protein
MKSRLPEPVPSGVKTSITSWEVPTGTQANIGTETTVPESAAVTVTGAVPIRVREPGNPVGKLLVV